MDLVFHVFCASQGLKKLLSRHTSEIQNNVFSSFVDLKNGVFFGKLLGMPSSMWFRNMAYGPSMMSRLLDIGQVFLMRVYGPRQS